MIKEKIYQFMLFIKNKFLDFLQLMKNLNNKRIIKTNYLKFKKTPELKQTIKLGNRKKLVHKKD
jgi:hypothetical protein